MKQILLMLMLTTSAFAGWWGNDEENHRQREQQLQQQLQQQQEANDGMAIAILVLAVGCVSALGVGAAIGSRTRRAYNAKE